MSAVCASPYPEQDERARVSDVTLRPLQPGDRASLLEIFAGLGPRSRELRLLAPKPRLTEADLRQLTAVDRQDHVALVATSATHGRPVGIARFVREHDEPDSADVAVAVVDDWQDRGVGTVLVAALVRRALEVGVRRFTLAVARDNDAVLALIRRLGADVEHLEVGREITELAVMLPAGTAAPRSP
jgi:RimJ/RimL family protein N-acetyltransferase